MSKQLKSCAGKENFQRMNYLYQASKMLADASKKFKNKQQQECSNFVSNYYSNLVVNIAKKTVLRIDSDIKRTICKCCRSLLIPGQTARVRLRKKPCQHVRWTCLKCYAFRIFNTNKNYSIWNEKPEALVEIIEYKDDNK